MSRYSIDGVTANNSGPIILEPVSIADVKGTISSSSNDLGTLCKSNNINVGSLSKPYVSSNLTTVINSITYNSTQYKYIPDSVIGYGWNVSGANRKYKPNLSDNKCYNLAGVNYPAYKDGNNGISPRRTLYNSFYGLTQTESGYMWTYIKPFGGENSKYRLTDFNGYNHALNSLITCEITPNISDSQNKSIFYTIFNTNYASNSALQDGFTFPMLNMFGLNFDNTLTAKIKVSGNGSRTLPLAKIVRLLLGIPDGTNIYVISTSTNATNVGSSWYNVNIPECSFSSALSESATEITVTLESNLTTSSNSSPKMLYTISLGAKYDDVYSTSDAHIIPVNGACGLKLVWQIPTSLIHWCDCLVGSGEVTGNMPYSNVGSYKRIRLSSNNNNLLKMRNFKLILNIHSNAKTIAGEGGISGPFNFYVPIMTNYQSSIYNSGTKVDNNFFFYMVIEQNGKYFVRKGRMLEVTNVSNAPSGLFLNNQYSSSNTNHPKLYFKHNGTGTSELRFKDDTQEYAYSTLPSCVKKINSNHTYKYTIALEFDYQNTSGIDNDSSATYVGFIVSPTVISEGRYRRDNEDKNPFDDAVSGYIFASPTTNQLDSLPTSPNTLYCYEDITS